VRRVTSFSSCTQCGSVTDKWPNAMWPEVPDVIALLNGCLQKPVLIAEPLRSYITSVTKSD
jgi:hypothetical protein